MKRIQDMSDEELRAEFESLRAEFEQADREAAPLLALILADEEDEDPFIEALCAALDRADPEDVPDLPIRYPDE